MAQNRFLELCNRRGRLPRLQQHPRAADIHNLAGIEDINVSAVNVDFPGVGGLNSSSPAFFGTRFFRSRRFFRRSLFSRGFFRGFFCRFFRGSRHGRFHRIAHTIEGFFEKYRKNE